MCLSKEILSINVNSLAVIKVLTDVLIPATMQEMPER